MKALKIQILIRQACLLPIYYLIPLLIAGSLVPNYNHISQHASEITITGYKSAKTWISIMCFVVGSSYLLLSIGIFLKRINNHRLVAFLFILFGISMYTNGIYPMGSPMHGCYGIGIFSIATPFLVGNTTNNEFKNKTINISIVVGMLMLFYLWILFSGLDPDRYNGLTQRMGALLFYGWTAYLAFVLTKDPNNEKK